MNLLPTIVAKSDQLNADDLVGGPRTITVKAVRGSDSPEQPVWIDFEGDDGKPYKPCKTCRRVLVHCWGPEASDFIGRRMTLYADPNVMFGGVKTGGIRISHVSHIEREMAVALMVTRGKRAQYTVKPLPPQDRAPRQQQASTGQQGATSELTLAQRSDNYETRLKGAPNSTKLRAIREAGAALRDALDAADPERLAELEQLFNERFEMLVDQEQEAAA